MLTNFNLFLLGAKELFSNPCKNGIASFIHDKVYFEGFTEGWALYGENPVLSHDVDLYKDNILQKLGMYKWQVGIYNIIKKLLRILRILSEWIDAKP